MLIYCQCIFLSWKIIKMNKTKLNSTNTQSLSPHNCADGQKKRKKEKKEQRVKQDVNTEARKRFGCFSFTF